MPSNRDMPFFASFDFDLARAVLAQLVEAFEELGMAPLAMETLSQVDCSPGVYQLFLGDRLMYVGKADKNLQKRLTEHLWTFKSRRNIDVDDIRFRCLDIHPNWAPLTHESLLIRHYRRRGGCEWNTAGLGNHDPGRRREDSAPNLFDTQYPINEQFACTGVAAGEYNCNSLLQLMKSSLPFVFRYQTTNPKQWRNGHPDYNALTINVPAGNMPAEDLLRLICSQLPGWQATIFRSHMILYAETRQYRSAMKVISI